MAAKDQLGQHGEDIAAQFLTTAGLRVLVRNWRCAEGELDIIAEDGDVLVFCEVKTRSGVAFGSPVEAVSRVKARRIRVLATRWLAQTDQHWSSTRFDVVGIVRRRGFAPVIDHVRGAF